MHIKYTTTTQMLILHRIISNYIKCTMSCKIIIIITLTFSIPPISGEPTIKEKAEKFLKELSLGRTATATVAKSKVSTFTKSFSKSARVLTANSTRGRRGVSVPCPSNNAEKRVCQDSKSECLCCSVPVSAHCIHTVHVCTLQYM